MHQTWTILRCHIFPHNHWSHWSKNIKSASTTQSTCRAYIHFCPDSYIIMEWRPWGNLIKLRYLLICVVTVNYCVTRTDLKLHYMLEWDLLKLKKQWQTPEEWKFHLFIFFINGEGNKETTLPFNSIKNWTGLIAASSGRDRTDCSFRGYSESFLLLWRWSVRWIYGGTYGQQKNKKPPKQKQNKK